MENEMGRLVKRVREEKLPAPRVRVERERPAGLPVIKLHGPDGNVFVVIGQVVSLLKWYGKPESAKEFKERVLACHSYEEVISLVWEYVENVDEE